MIKHCAETELDRIFIMFGNACNFRCRYCLQNCMSNNTLQNEPTEELYQYIEHLIRIRPSYLNKILVMFWGGEPLIYFNNIKKVVSRLKDRVDYSIVTNGSLLTSDIVKYINKYNISLTLSHDGPNTVCTRKINVLDNETIYKLLLKVKKLNIESVTSMYNYDYSQLFKYIDDKFGDKVSNVYVDRLQITWDMPKDIYDIPLDDYNDKLRYLAGSALIDMINLVDGKAVRLFQPYVDTILNNTKVILPKCGTFYKTLNVDCFGNIYICHNSSDVIGHIGEERAVLATKYEKWFNDRIDKSCENCHLFMLCGGGCPLSYEYREKLCEINKVFYNVCVDLANTYVNSLEPIDWSVANND